MHTASTHAHRTVCQRPYTRCTHTYTNNHQIHANRTYCAILNTRVRCTAQSPSHLYWYAAYSPVDFDICRLFSSEIRGTSRRRKILFTAWYPLTICSFSCIKINCCCCKLSQNSAWHDWILLFGRFIVSKIHAKCQQKCNPYILRLCYGIGICYCFHSAQREHREKKTCCHSIFVFILSENWQPNQIHCCRCS